MTTGMDGEVFALVGEVVGGASATSADDDHHDVRDCAAVWRHALISQNLHAAQRLAVFETSHAAFSHVLQSAPHATISMQLYGSDPAATAMELTLAAETLATRGRLPTKVVVDQADHLHATLDLVHEHLLQPAGGHLTQLSLQLHNGKSPRAVSDFLTAASAALPNLQQLHLGGLATPVPPGLFPKLTELQVEQSTWRGAGWHQQQVCNSITPYLPQLITLRVTEGFERFAWSPIFTPTTTSHTLRHLHTNTNLDNDLLSLLLQHAPALQQLSVPSLSFWTDYSQATWGVQQITTQRWELEASNLLHLPINHSGQRVAVVCHVRDIRVVMPALSEQGLPNVIVDGLFSRFQFTRLCCALKVVMSLPANQQTAWLNDALHQLATAQQSPQPLAVEVDAYNTYFNKNHWSPELLQSLSAAAAALPQLHITLSFGNLDNSLLDALLQHAQAVWGVKANCLWLFDKSHSTTQQSWSSLTVGTIDNVESLLYLPTPSEGGRLVEGLEDITLALTPAQVESGVVHDIIARTQRFGVGLAPEARVCVATNDRDVTVADQPAVLRANLRLLREMGLVNRQGEAVSKVGLLSLHGWTLTPAVIGELAGLPQWCGELGFAYGTWPAERPAEEYQLLGRVVPVTYAVWWVSGSVRELLLQVRVLQLVAVCRGVADARVGQKPLQLRLREPLDRDRIVRELKVAVAQLHLEKAVHVV